MTAEKESAPPIGSANAHVDRIANESPRVRALTRGILTLADRLAPIIDLCRIYVDGVENLPRDGRFLLVGNHTLSGSAEVVLIPYFVHRELGVRVRGLANRDIGDTTGIFRDVLEAAGAVPGEPDTCAELMRRGETILVFPGGGRDMLKFKGEEYTLQWERRSGFARMAIAHDYPIVPVGLVGGDDVYHSLVERDGTWEKRTRALGERLHGLPGVGIPIVRGVGPSLIPRPQRMYLRFGAPIDTARPPRIGLETWISTVKDQAQNALHATLTELQELRSTDPYRNLNPLAYGRAVQPR